MAPPIRSRQHARSLATAAAGISLHAAPAARAQAPSDPEARAEFDRNNDPAEPTNRRIFAANQFVDRNALRPLARAYESNVPGRVRRSLHNFTNNLGQPAVAVNDLLQGAFSRAWTTTQRFAINTTVGGAGLFDVATDWGRPGHEADFGQTLGARGMGPGPAVQLPLLGPSDVRDNVGKLAGLATNPVTFVPGGAISAVRSASGGVRPGGRAPWHRLRRDGALSLSRLPLPVQGDRSCGLAVPLLQPGPSQRGDHPRCPRRGRVV